MVFVKYRLFTKSLLIPGGARLVIGSALSFAFFFDQEYLDVDLSTEFREDDTWRVLIDDLRGFADAHGRRIEKKMQEKGTPTIYCEQCETPTVPLSWVGAVSSADIGRRKMVDHTALVLTQVMLRCIYAAQL